MAGVSAAIPKFTARNIPPAVPSCASRIMKFLPSLYRLCSLTSITLIFVSATAAADESSVDTSQWKCAQCPFLQGYETQTEGGVLYANGANATFGRYTGIDHSGVYADVAASGQARGDDGAYFNYDLERLGLASRDGYVEGGSEGRCGR